MRAPIEATAGSLRMLIRLVVVSLEVVRYEYSCGCGELEGLWERLLHLPKGFRDSSGHCLGRRWLVSCSEALNLCVCMIVLRLGVTCSLCVLALSVHVQG